MAFSGEDTSSSSSSLGSDVIRSVRGFVGRVGQGSGFSGVVGKSDSFGGVCGDYSGSDDEWDDDRSPLLAAPYHSVNSVHSVNSTLIDEIDGDGKKEDNIIEMDKRTFYLNIAAVLVVSVIGEACRGLTVATLPLYMETELGGTASTYSFTVSMFSVGRVLGGLSLGSLAHRWSVCACVILALSIGIIGNLMYAAAIMWEGDSLENAIFPTTGALVAFLGRCLVGYGSTAVILVRILLAQITTPKERTRYIGWANAGQFVGSSLLPGLAPALLNIPTFYIGPWEINGFNSPGLLLAFLNICAIGFCLLFMTRLPPTATKTPPPPPSPELEESLLQKAGGYLWIFFNFDTRSAISFIETAGTFLYLQSIQPDCDQAAVSASLYFFYMGLGGFFVFFICEWLDKIFSSLLMLQTSIFLIGVGLFLNISLDPPIDPWRFIVASLLIWSVGSPISQVMMISSFSRMLGHKPQGRMQGAIASGGSVGRILAPLVVNLFLYDCWGCPGQPEHCDAHSLGLPTGDSVDHTNIIFYISGSITFLAFFLLTGYKWLLSQRAGAVLAMIDAKD
mmetsp:Transcript_32820/g.45061  ORF Transcript_32820/g.45061 Transcript_32820/m.45061 type:complete len:563 (-) Transcript_32820:271-1959(-)|eukprot:CAMPEP_0201480004 /NCGR_PEP_ID=MMETSP0151_2-20130828/4606_1 /ASSEMBLY_ACC=CAM_ASM_000257 /TAXON_ID=200890 /ORGANISM="Paramoeba atlantica, Strain 621/1 / CCAP 1560/9" /LENGTH=562 /DNA_ID=CAMNT_0047861745 /DNA_START=33 /DNA_END=1721 /DNA_ORIENTATION=-